MSTPQGQPINRLANIPPSRTGDLRPRLFDSHFHIIDPRFPLIPNQGYLPPLYSVADYKASTANFHIVGGAVVSGSFQSFDQRYLVAALLELGPHFVGVTQLPAEASDELILELDEIGVRAVRFNLYRGGSESIGRLEEMAQRVFELVGWHVELYVNSRDLPDLIPRLLTLPRVSIDHLGLSREGLPHVLKLAEQGVYVKATGFGRCDFDVPEALRAIYAANPDALIFGTDLPSTRAPRSFEEADVALVVETLGAQASQQVLFENAYMLYKLA
jgi:predicted TIM-barrel fold metal-dependent hydrolase